MNCPSTQAMSFRARRLNRFQSRRYAILMRHQQEARLVYREVMLLLDDIYAEQSKPKAKPKKSTKRKVTFRDHNDVFLIPSLDKEAITDMWWSREDYRQFLYNPVHDD